MLVENLRQSSPVKLASVQCLSKFTRADLPPDELKLFRELVNESFFYRGHPAALVTGSLTYFGIGKILPHLPFSYKATLTFFTSILGSWVARQSYLPTMRERVFRELSPHTYLRQAVETGAVFRSTLFSEHTNKLMSIRRNEYHQQGNHQEKVETSELRSSQDNIETSISKVVPKVNRYGDEIIDLK